MPTITDATVSITAPGIEQFLPLATLNSIYTSTSATPVAVSATTSITASAGGTLRSELALQPIVLSNHVCSFSHTHDFTATHDP